VSLGTLLVVEDDEAIRRGLVDAVKFAGYRVLEAADGPSGLDVALGADVDLVLLDILLPGIDGLTVLREIRTMRSGLPVIMLTAKGEEADRVRGLRLGADDYVIKPFSATELLARIEAVLRRSAERPAHVSEVSLAGCRVNFERREVCFESGERVTLPQREAEVLAYLVANAGRAVSRDELLQRVWGVDPRGMNTRTVDMAVARLREQLRDDSGSPSMILTVRAKGYMLAQNDAEPGDKASELEHEAGA
jgi:two-component system, OmpR family, alkaline phosphatase synthesis response regulator PhoP